ncbi:MAG: hypothetical protein F4X75_27150 [Gemmatimonadetes bacterium]|nr:hypothetical protein [Gemmatimonadota bacterium]
MNSVNDLHKKAMEFADLGLRRRARGNAEESIEYFEQALHYELAAIDELDKTEALAWAVLHRSAGTLALDCRDFLRAEKIVATALAQEPHPEVAEELRDLLEQIYFQRHLDLKGITLQEDEIQLSLSGQEVGNGFVNVEEVYERISSSSKLIHRTVERKQNRPFRERGSVQKAIRENYQTLVSVPRSGSFSVTLKFSRPQLYFSGMLETAAIIDEFMDLLALINSSHITEIQKRIPDPAYLRNFFGLARKIAPDGERISQVGFTSVRDGEQRSVGLTMPASELPSLPPEMLSSQRVEPQQTTPREPIEIRGILRHADAMREDSNVIQVIDGNKRHTVQVPQGMMNDIVRPMWDSHVIIQGVDTGEYIMLEDIQLDDSA